MHTLGYLAPSQVDLGPTLYTYPVAGHDNGWLVQFGRALIDFGPKYVSARCKKKAIYNKCGIKDLGLTRVSDFRDFPSDG